MLKTAVIVLAILWVVSTATGYLFWGNAKEKIKEAEQNLDNYKAQYSSTIQKGDSLESIVKSLQAVGGLYQKQIDSLENMVDSLEVVREEGVIRVANLFQPDSLVDEMKQTFPELKGLRIGVARVPDPETGFKLRVFQVPIQFVATFIADHKDAENYREQVATLGEVNVTFKKYVALQDSVITLKEEKAEEYKKGLDYGLKRYEEMTKEYIDTLKKPPKFSLFSSKLSAVAGAAAGVAAGVVIGRGTK